MDGHHLQWSTASDTMAILSGWWTTRRHSIQQAGTTASTAHLGQPSAKVVPVFPFGVSRCRCLMVGALEVST